jgi:hypothetical protein
MLAKYNDLLLRLFVAFGLLTAVTGIAQYISGKLVNDALEETIETLKSMNDVSVTLDTTKNGYNGVQTIYKSLIYLLSHPHHER